MAYEAPQLHNKQAKMNTLAFSSSQPWFLVPEDSFSRKVSIFWYGERYSYKDLILQLISEGIYLERITYITATIAGEEVK